MSNNSKRNVAKWLQQNINFQVPPPEQDNSFIPIYRPKPGVRLVGAILATELTECQTHWVDEQTLPCLGPRIHCPFCARGIRQRWYGYLPIQGLNGRIILLCVTTGLLRAIPGLKGPEPILHKRITVERVTGGKRGRLVGKLEKWEAKGCVFHPCPNVCELLANVWSGPLSELGIQLIPTHEYDEDCECEHCLAHEVYAKRNSPTPDKKGKER